MSQTEVIEIKVNGTEFDAFARKFLGIKEGAKERIPSPFEKWASDADKNMSDIARRVTNFVNVVDHTKNAMGKAADNGNSLVKSIIYGGVAAKKLSGTMMNIAASAKDTTLTMTKWASLGGGLVAGGIFGLSKLADGVSKDATEARGMGTTSGNLKAGKHAFSFLGDGTFEHDTAMMHSAQANVHANDPNTAKLLKLLNMDNLDKFRAMDPAVLTTQMYAALKNAPKEDHDFIRANYNGMLSEGTLTILQQRTKASNEQFDLAVRDFGRWSRNLQLSERTENGYQHTKSVFGAEWDRVVNSFVASVGGMNGPLQKLVHTFGDVAVGAISSPGFKKGINAFAKWIKDDAPTDIAKFSSYIQMAIEGVMDVVEMIPGTKTRRSLVADKYKKGTSATDKFIYQQATENSATHDNPLLKGSGYIDEAVNAISLADSKEQLRSLMTAWKDEQFRLSARSAEVLAEVFNSKAKSLHFEGNFSFPSNYPGQKTFLFKEIYTKN